MTIRIPYKLFPYQKKYEDRAKGKRFLDIVGGRRSGKSKFGQHWLLKDSLEDENDGLSVWCAPTVKQAINIGYREFINSTRTWPRHLIEQRRTEQQLIICGKEFFFTSSDNADSMRGLKIKRIVMDEAAYQRERDWVEIIRPALADLQGKVLMLSTYKGFNWFYDITKNDTFVHDIWPTAINPIIKTEEIENMKEQMDEQAFKQEILCIPTTAKGLVYEKVFGIESITPRAGWTKRKQGQIALSIDFGYNDPCVVGFFEWWIEKDGYPNIIQFDEIKMRFELIEHILTAIINKLRIYNIEPQGLPLACDIAGLQTTGTGAGYIERIASKRIFKILYMKIGIEERINLVRSFLLNAAGKRRFHICDNCIETIKEITAYEIKKGEKVISINDHAPDMIGYFFANVILPIIPKKIIMEREKNEGKAQMRKCLTCGKAIITFKGENYCKECADKIRLEV